MADQRSKHFAVLLDLFVLLPDELLLLTDLSLEDIVELGLLNLLPLLNFKHDLVELFDVLRRLDLNEVISKDIFAVLDPAVRILNAK